MKTNRPETELLIYKNVNIS